MTEFSEGGESSPRDHGILPILQGLKSLRNVPGDVGMLLKLNLLFLPRQILELRIQEFQLGQEFDGTYTQKAHLKEI